MSNAGLFPQRQPPLTLGVRLATFLVLIQCLLWCGAGLVRLHQGESHAQSHPALVVVDVPHPRVVGAVNILTALVLGWWQYRAVLARSKLAAPLVAGGFLTLGVLTCLSLEASPMDLGVGLARAAAGGLMARWAAQLLWIRRRKE